MSDIVLDIKNLKKSFGQNEVLKDIHMTVASGEVISIIGSSGSGKSTLLRSINLLEQHLAKLSTKAKMSSKKAMTLTNTAPTWAWFSNLSIFSIT